MCANSKRTLVEEVLKSFNLGKNRNTILDKYRCHVCVPLMNVNPILRAERLNQDNKVLKAVILYKALWSWSWVTFLTVFITK